MSNILRSTMTILNKFFPKKNNKISLWGRQMVNDNTEQLLSYLVENGYNKKYKIYCHFEQKEKFKKYECENVFIESSQLKSMFHMFTSRYIFHAQGLSKMSFKSSRKQKIFDTQHGISYIDKNNNRNLDYLDYVDDYVLTTSEGLIPMHQHMYGFPKEKFFVDGNPRCDLLFSDKKVLEQLGYDKFDKVILYMPTYRQSDINGDDSESCYPLLDEYNIIEVNEKLKALNMMMIIKPHPLQKALKLFETNYSNLNVVTNDDLRKDEIKLYELVGKADALITDFSTISSDYLILDRPIGFVLDDIEEYKKGRGILAITNDGKVVENPDTLSFPGQNINTIEDLYLFLDNLSKSIDEYKEARADKNKLVNKYRDNQNTKRIFDFMGITK